MTTATKATAIAAIEQAVRDLNYAEKQYKLIVNPDHIDRMRQRFTQAREELLHHPTEES